ncbi:MAG: DUF1993 domain-containing protein [Paraglaciecola sp.]|uniref:DUF1993 domain-containing protein n=1 Tax=Paraglaciecola sp. TaxID=1920173 RepID=UPI0032663D27
MLSLYDITISNFLRTLEATIVVMKKGEEFFKEHDIDPNDIVTMRLAEDMLPFSAQVNIASHNAAGAIQALFDGEFTPPQISLDSLDYTALIAHFEKTVDTLKVFDEEKVNALFGKTLRFKVGGYDLPFTTENFMMSFAIPNVYFHTTTIYDMLRIKGVPLGKKDYLGQMVVGAPE